MLHYLYPQARSTITTAIQLTVKVEMTDNSQQHTMDKIREKFAAVFDRQIMMMERKEFHILLVAGAIFCVKTPQSVPFACREKIIVQLELLQKQVIITLNIEVTEWCAPIMVTPKGYGSHKNVAKLYVRMERYNYNPKLFLIQKLFFDIKQ